MARKPRPLAPGTTASATLQSILRVDQAGEYGAVRIYQGQLDVLGARRTAARPLAAIRRMAEGEKQHLARFDELLPRHGVRPTLLRPLWWAAGYALGAGTALLGTEAAMACTAAVEEVIDGHYERQLDRLEEGEVRDVVAAFRRDELSHRAEALAQGAERAPFYGIVRAAIVGGCRLAIALSERL
jgi:ubiquinone biosynthesis monooxygenase Coq7